MANYSDFDVTEKLKEIESDIDLLMTLCASKETKFIGFNIAGVTKEQEKNALQEQIDSIAVTPLSEWFHIHHVILGWKAFYKRFDLSTRFVDRYPGLVVPAENHKEIALQVKKINANKKEFAEMIRCERTQQESHEYIHSLFPQIMTDQIYRKIRVVDQTVTKAWFNWTTRNVPETFTKEEAKTYLEGLKRRPRFMFDKEDWISLVDKLITDVDSGIYDKFQKFKNYKQIPTVELQMVDEHGIIKRQKITATTPIILLKQPGNALPKGTPLTDYIAKDHKGGMSQLPPNKVILDRQLKFIGIKE